MARLDYYRPASGQGWILDVQANELDGLNTRVVVPLLPPSLAPKPGRRLNPVFLIEGEEQVMVTQFLSVVQLSFLQQRGGSLADRRDEITAALDFLLLGF